MGEDGKMFTWLLCWTDSCTIGLIASSRSLVIVMALVRDLCLLSLARLGVESDVQFPARVDEYITEARDKLRGIVS